jgi:hypothetical protein
MLRISPGSESSGDDEMALGVRVEATDELGVALASGFAGLGDPRGVFEG